jgi:Mycobacterium membrane protein
MTKLEGQVASSPEPPQAWPWPQPNSRMKSSSIGRLVKRRWTVIVAVLVVAVVAFTVDRLHGIFGSHNTVSRPSADSLHNTGYDPKRVLFVVFGSPGSVATINYLDEHAQPQRVDDATLPWSRLLTTEDPTLFADLRAQGDGDSIGCRITVNGVVKDERSTSNVNGYIACLDKSA